MNTPAERIGNYAHWPSRFVTPKSRCRRQSAASPLWMTTKGLPSGVVPLAASRTGDRGTSGPAPVREEPRRRGPSPCTAGGSDAGGPTANYAIAMPPRGRAGVGFLRIFRGACARTLDCARRTRPIIVVLNPKLKGARGMRPAGPRQRFESALRG